MLRFPRRVRAAMAVGLAVLSFSAVALAGRPAAAQGSVGFGQIRPFVIGFIPVPGRNGVGGVLIDAKGTLDRVDVDWGDKLRQVRLEAMQPVPDALGRQVPLRKISLRRIEAAILAAGKNKQPLPDAVQFLGGLQRIEYVIAYPEHQDIVLAGPAEGWVVGPRGDMVGAVSGQPVLQLDDLIVALRTAEAAARGDGITCSIDPNPQGLRRLQRAMRSATARNVSPQSVAGWERALGPQQITMTGVDADTNFARVMLAADFVMKRLAMKLEPSRVAGLPSYMELIENDNSAAPQNASPRWWLAPNYQAMLTDPDQLTWQLRGQGVKAMTEDGYLRGSKVIRTGRAHPLAQRWAELFTRHFEDLAAREPALARLRNCIDLAVAAAVIHKHRLDERVGYKMPLLRDPKQVEVARFHAPKTVDSRASLVRKGNQWVVAVSGGVDLDSWAVLDAVQPSPRVAVTAVQSAPRGDRWWWD